MPRQPLIVRDAVPEDAPELVQLWLDAGYPVEPSRCETTEFGHIIAEVAADPDQRIVVGVHSTAYVCHWSAVPPFGYVWRAPMLPSAE